MMIPRDRPPGSRTRTVPEQVPFLSSLGFRRPASRNARPEGLLSASVGRAYCFDVGKLTGTTGLFSHFRLLTTARVDRNK